MGTDYNSKLQHHQHRWDHGEGPQDGVLDDLDDHGKGPRDHGRGPLGTTDDSSRLTSEPLVGSTSNKDHHDRCENRHLSLQRLDAIRR